MTITDWSATSADQLVQLYSDEAARWRSAFDWDTAAQWHEVEHARTHWNLPGLVARDGDGRISGWLYYLPTQDGAQLGGVSADDAATARALVDGFAVRERGKRISGFMPELAPGVAAALTHAGFAATPHLYLVAPLTTTAADEGIGAGAAIRPWTAGDEARAAVVLRDAYAPADAALFAPNGTPAEWQTYVVNLVEQIGCGRFIPQASLVAGADGVPTGTAIVTRLSADTAHLAQIAVRRERQGRGEGLRLLRHAMAAARAAGAASLSLIVSTLNDDAVRFYARQGFVERGRFLEAASPLAS